MIRARTGLFFSRGERGLDVDEHVAALRVGTVVHGGLGGGGALVRVRVHERGRGARGRRGLDVDAEVDATLAATPGGRDAAGVDLDLPGRRSVLADLDAIEDVDLDVGEVQVLVGGHVAAGCDVLDRAKLPRRDLERRVLQNLEVELVGPDRSSRRTGLRGRVVGGESAEAGQELDTVGHGHGLLRCW